MFPLATIGYEGASLTAVIAKLWAASVGLVLDVRAIAASRRPGFSKGVLSASLAEAGIDYRHLRALGTPKSGRQAARAGQIDLMRDIYEAHLEDPQAQAELALATELALHQPAPCCATRRTPDAAIAPSSPNACMSASAARSWICNAVSPKAAAGSPARPGRRRPSRPRPQVRPGSSRIRIRCRTG